VSLFVALQFIVNVVDYVFHGLLIFVAVTVVHVGGFVLHKNFVQSFEFANFEIGISPLDKFKYAYVTGVKYAKFYLFVVKYPCNVHIFVVCVDNVEFIVDKSVHKFVMSDSAIFCHIATPHNVFKNCPFIPAVKFTNFNKFVKK